MRKLFWLLVLTAIGLAGAPSAGHEQSDGIERGRPRSVLDETGADWQEESPAAARRRRFQQQQQQQTSSIPYSQVPYDPLSTTYHSSPYQSPYGNSPDGYYGSPPPAASYSPPSYPPTPYAGTDYGHPYYPSYQAPSPQQYAPSPTAYQPPPSPPPYSAAIDYQPYQAPSTSYDSQGSSSGSSRQQQPSVYQPKSSDQGYAVQTEGYSMNPDYSYTPPDYNSPQYSSGYQNPSSAYDPSSISPAAGYPHVSPPSPDSYATQQLDPNAKVPVRINLNLNINNKADSGPQIPWWLLVGQQYGNNYGAASSQSPGYGNSYGYPPPPPYYQPPSMYDPMAAYYGMQYLGYYGSTTPAPAVAEQMAEEPTTTTTTTTTPPPPKAEFSGSGGTSLQGTRIVSTPMRVPVRDSQSMGGGSQDTFMEAGGGSGSDQPPAPTPPPTTTTPPPAPRVADQQPPPMYAPPAYGPQQSHPYYQHPPAAYRPPAPAPQQPHRYAAPSPPPPRGPADPPRPPQAPAYSKTSPAGPHQTPAPPMGGKAPTSVRSTDCSGESNVNCVLETRISCSSPTEATVELRFKSLFHGKIYVWGRHRDCVLYGAPLLGTRPDTRVTLKLAASTCPGYQGFSRLGPISNSTRNAVSAQPGQSRVFRIMVQFDPNLVSRQDVNFLLDCTWHQTHSGHHEPTFRYTVVDDNPIVLKSSTVGGRDSRRFRVIMREGTTLDSPEVSGPVVTGSFLLLQIEAVTRDHDIHLLVESCTALEDQPANNKDFPAYGSEDPRRASVELAKNGCSVRPNVMESFKEIFRKSDRGDHRITSAAALMQAFRFPGSDAVIIKCKVNVCAGLCPGTRPCPETRLSTFKGQLAMAAVVGRSKRSGKEVVRDTTFIPPESWNSTSVLMPFEFGELRLTKDKTGFGESVNLTVEMGSPRNYRSSIGGTLLDSFIAELRFHGGNPYS